VNERILAPQVRVVDSSGQQLGVMSPQQALQIARAQGLDLIEIAPQENPPVCRIMDYGHYRYEQRRREKEISRKQRTRDLKMITLRPNIDKHDLETKARRVDEFLRQGRKVRLQVRFRGIDMRHTERGAEVLLRLAETCKEVGNIESQPVLEGRNMTMILAPVRGLTAKPAPAKSAAKPPAVYGQPSDSTSKAQPGEAEGVASDAEALEEEAV